MLRNAALQYSCHIRRGQLVPRVLRSALLPVGHPNFELDRRVRHVFEVLAILDVNVEHAEQELEPRRVLELDSVSCVRHFCDKDDLAHVERGWRVLGELGDLVAVLEDSDLRGKKILENSRLCESIPSTVLSSCPDT